MSDNVVANPGVGGATFATDDILGVQYPRTKITIGADGVNDGDISGSNPLPVSAIGTVNVAGTFYQATQPVSIAAPVAVTGTFYQATQPVSLASAVAVTGTFWQATQPVSGTVAATQSGTWTVQPGNTANTTAWKVDASSVAVPVTDNSGSLTVDNAGTFSVQVSSITPPTLTKGTQGSTGYSTQDLKDAGRTSLVFYAIAAAAGTTTTETAITLTKAAGTGATSTAVSFVVTSGKRFIITHLSVATRGNNTATAQTTTFNMRVNTGGAVITSTTPIVFAARSATPATANAWDRYVLPIPDGYEILGDGTLQFGITAAATYTTNAPTWDVTLIGFEY